MAQMHVDEPEVFDTVREPEVDKPDGQGNDNRIARKGRIAVVYEPEGNRKKVVTVLWEGRDDRSEGPPTHVPNKPSNRVFLDKLQLWGCTVGRKRSDWVQVRTPNGQILEVRPAGYSKGNPARTLVEGYRAVGASAEEFWARTTKVRPPRERVHAAPSDFKFPRDPAGSSGPPPPEPAGSPAPNGHKPLPDIDTVSGRVMAYYRAYANEVPKVDVVARELGVEVDRVKAVLYFLAADGHLQKVGPNQYTHKVWGQTDAHKAKAQADLAYATDPVNRLPEPVRRPRKGAKKKVKAATVAAPPRNGVPIRPGYQSGATGVVLDHYRAHAGEWLTMPDVAADLGLPLKTINNAVGNLGRTGRLEKGKRGIYRFPAVEVGTTTAADPLARLDAIQARLEGNDDTPVAPVDNDEPTVPPEPEPEPEPAPPPVPRSEPAPVVALRPPVTFDDQQTAWLRGEDVTAQPSVDDEIDALLELLVPNGLKARHLATAASWVVATRNLLELTRADR